MPSLTVVQWMLVVFSAAGIGMSKAGLGGMGMFAIIIMAKIFPARESTGLILPMLILADFFAVWAYRRHVQGAVVLRMLPPAVVGVVCGWLIMPHVASAAFGPLIGWVTLCLLALMLVQKLAPNLLRLAADHPGVAWPLGWLAGATTMLANAAGPVMAIYFLACRMPKWEFVGTAAWYFWVVNLIKVPFSASLGLITGGSLVLNLIVAPAVVAGIFIGRWAMGKINQTVFEWLMIVFSLLGALRLVVG